VYELVKADFLESRVASDASINRHFVWLARYFHPGVNQYLFDSGDTRNYPLRTEALRRIVPTSIETYLTAGSALPIDEEADALNLNTAPFVRPRPTRISQLVRNAYQSAQQVKRSGSAVVLPSFLGIAYQLLTHPEHPGTQAYAQIAIRNFLFDWLNLFPSEEGAANERANISSSSIEKASSTFWTYMRPRFESRGADALDLSDEGSAENLVKHYLAARRLFQYRFEGIEAAARHCLSDTLTFENCDLVRASQTARVPDRGEIVNELLGIPIPIRGADTIFRGGLRVSARKGLVLALHGGPGSGKTSLALCLGASLAPFGIKTLYFTAEEVEDDLIARVDGVIPEALKRLSFAMPTEKWLTVRRITTFGSGSHSLVRQLQDNLDFIGKALNDPSVSGAHSGGVPPASRAIVILDGLQDFFERATESAKQEASQVDPATRPLTTQHVSLHGFLDSCRELKALVILTTGVNWSGDSQIDYLVDTALTLSHGDTNKIDSKPHREIILTKARHQFCATGAHGFQLSGSKGVRFSPQINYQLERRAIWRNSLHDETRAKNVLRIAINQINGNKFEMAPSYGPFIFANSNIFINGRGSGGKAALALKIAIAPSFYLQRPRILAAPASVTGRLIPGGERILLISFLYPQEYYRNILGRLIYLRRREYSEARLQIPRLQVEQLFPGYLRPVDLFNRIEWTLEAAELQGEPFTTVIIDGIHNVFIQFPELESHQLIWPQMYTLLRSREVSIITTHTTLVLPRGLPHSQDLKIDDDRSEPLRHALVQKTDFQFELAPHSEQNSLSDSRYFELTTLSAIGQPVPPQPLLWDRERMMLVSSRLLF